MCMRFGCSPQINFCYFFSPFEFSQVWTQLWTKHYRHWVYCVLPPTTILGGSFWNCADVFVKVLNCARDLDVILI